jgi:hypothetical protein
MPIPQGYTKSRPRIVRVRYTVCHDARAVNVAGESKALRAGIQSSYGALMLRSPLTWMIFGAIVVAALLAWLTLTRVAGSAGATDSFEHHELAPFHEVEIGGVAEILLIQDNTEAIDVDAAPRTTVSATVANGRLAIHASDRRRWWNRLLGHRSAEAPTITLHLRTLDTLALGGNVKISIPKLATQTLRIGASGGASLTIDDLQATTLRVEGSGALKAELGGRVDEQLVSISGAGSYRAERLRATNATVAVSGVGNVVVNVERRLRASISGAGLIEYLGDPQVVEHVSGIGRVRRRDSSAVPGVRIADGAPPFVLAACQRALMQRAPHGIHALEQQRTAGHRIDVPVDSDAHLDALDSTVAEQRDEHRCHVGHRLVRVHRTSEPFRLA